LQRWLEQAGLNPPPLLRVAVLDDRRATEPHQVWQMDAVECLRLGDGSGACWLRMTDECSGAILATELFPQYRWSQVPDREVQDAIRRSYQRRGCPGALRVDNGKPWGCRGGLPTAMSLWSAGLGVPMHRNDPYCPQQNGVVESTQGVSQRWAEPGRCANFAELCRRVREEDAVQREQYPAINGMSRWQAYPGLVHSGRGYTRSWEEAVWDLGEALRFLGQFRVPRRITRIGQVSLYRRPIQAVSRGQAREGYAGLWVYVWVDPQTVEWVVSDLEGGELHRRAALPFSREAICNLELSDS
jgi:transposase InsO family protein